MGQESPGEEFLAVWVPIEWWVAFNTKSTFSNCVSHWKKSLLRLISNHTDLPYHPPPGLGKVAVASAWIEDHLGRIVGRDQVVKELTDAGRRCGVVSLGARTITTLEEWSWPIGQLCNTRLIIFGRRHLRVWHVRAVRIAAPGLHGVFEIDGYRL